MSKIYDVWERLVKAILLREELREIARAPSRDPSFSSDSPDFSFNSSIHDDVPVNLQSPEAPSSPSIPSDSFQNRRNLRIEAFKHTVVVDPKFADKTWKILEHAIHEIYYHRSRGLIFEDLYRHAYNMVLHKFGEQLYSGLVSTMTFHVRDMCESIEASHGGAFLEELIMKWTDHNQALQMIRDIVTYMDRTFVPSTSKTPIHEIGLNIWRDNVIRSSKIQTRLQNTLLELILEERNGEVMDIELMRNTMKMLMALGSSVYQEDFEKPFLKVSADFYRVESQVLIEIYDCADYLKKVERRVDEEIERVSHYLDAKSEAKITDIVVKEMIANHMHRLLHMENSGLVKMLLDDKYKDLGRMYSLFSRVPDGLSTILDVMTPHIREIGKQLVTDPQKWKTPVGFVDSLLEKRDKYDKIMNLAFNNDETFQNAFNSSFEYCVNLNPLSLEYTSLFVHDKLHKGVKEEDIDIILDKVPCCSDTMKKA